MTGRLQEDLISHRVKAATLYVSNSKRIVERQKTETKKHASFLLRTLSLSIALVKCDNRWSSSSSDVQL